MKSQVISVDQSTQSTKAFLFDENGKLLNSAGLPHKQIFPREGWVEHDPMEIYANTVEVIKQVVSVNSEPVEYSLALTNQRETVVVWNKNTGLPICNAVVWQCMRGKDICDDLKEKGFSEMVKAKSGLLIDPYFSGSGVKWILDNVDGARAAAEAGDLMMGTIDSWLIYKLTGGKVHATDYTNASRTLLFNVHTLDWDDELLAMLTVPRSMMPKALPCDAVYGETTVEGLFETPIKIAGVLGDSHGALAGQMCFAEGLGKATYGTGSSVMVNIGEKYADAPSGLVTSVGFSALGKVFYAFEGNIHCTGATISWLIRELQLIETPQQAEDFAVALENNGGVYVIPAFAGLGAPWWHPEVRGQIYGLTLGTGKPHICRATLESIAYQVTDLISAMTNQAGIALKEVRVDGGPTKNKRFLMPFQADLLGVPVVLAEVEDASAYGAFVINGFARGKWNSFEEAESTWVRQGQFTPDPETQPKAFEAYDGWKKAVAQLIK
ncbi:MAG: glycerol kinase GlpK [Bacteroidales bacterium]|nr:glycerol kinase GlpK [Bacteroidales bacterium]